MIWLKYNWFQLTILGMIALVTLIILTERVVAYKIYEITHPPRIVNSTMLDANGELIKPISLSTSDGLQLAGWYLPPKNGAAIILQHGYHTNSEEMLPIALMLARHGYGVLLFDFRGHGRSEGEMVTFGLNEVKDTEAALAFLRSQPEVNPGKIGLIGNSMGGAVGILAAAELKGIQAVVVEGVFAKLEDEISISPRPILILQGGADKRIPLDSGDRLFAAAGAPKEYWYEPMIAHATFSTSIPTEYEERIISFFDKCLNDLRF